MFQHHVLFSNGFQGNTDANARCEVSDPLSFGYQYFAGAIVVFLAGMLASFGNSGFDTCCDIVRRRFVFTIEFLSCDETLIWMSNWVSEHPSSANTRNVSVFSSFRSLGLLRSETDKQQQDHILLPTGWIILKHKNRWILITRSSKPKANHRSLAESSNMRLYVLGGSKQFLLDLLEEAREAYETKKNSRTRIYVADEYSYWNLTSSRMSRPLSTVLTWPLDRSGAVLDDCKRFLEAEQWYASRGIPWRRGYLLHGPPGTGKTSLVSALAGALELPIYVVHLSGPKLTDQSFIETLNGSASRCILLLEDIDAAFRQRNSEDVAGGLTFSGLLNALDGVVAQEGRLVFMTTNHLERLDPALVRPGRVDLMVEFHLCTKEMVSAYLRSFYTDISEEEVAEFVEAVPSGALSIAQLQACFLKHAHTPLKALTEIKSVIREMVGH